MLVWKYVYACHVAGENTWRHSLHFLTVTGSVLRQLEDIEVNSSVKLQICDSTQQQVDLLWPCSHDMVLGRVHGLRLMKQLYIL